jgi:hypothetical protein
MICWTREAAADTTKIVPCRTIGPRDMMTDRTFLRGIGRIDIYYRNASNGSFVIYELPELIETPRKMRASLSLLNRSPLPYALKIFKGDDRRSVFGFRNHFLGDAMINISSESGFSLTDLLRCLLALGYHTSEDQL